MRIPRRIIITLARVVLSLARIVVVEYGESGWTVFLVLEACCRRVS
jgi:hypothetical protein